MIEIGKKTINFDLMKNLPQELIDEFSRKWRDMNREFFINFIQKWEALPKGSIVKSFSRDKIEEIIVKGLKGNDIFSIEVEEEKVYGIIEQYINYWNVIYILSGKKLILFTQ